MSPGYTELRIVVPVDQGHDFGAGVRSFAERAAHGGGDHGGPGFFTPRMVMQVCTASQTTATPCGLSSSSIMSAIWLVIRSCTCGRRANASTTRASLEMPTIFAVGNVGDVRLAEKRHQMMLAHREKRDVLDQHHLVVLFVELLRRLTRGSSSPCPKISSYIRATRSGVSRNPSRSMSSPIA